MIFVNDSVNTIFYVNNIAAKVKMEQFLGKDIIDKAILRSILVTYIVAIILSLVELK